MKLQQRFSRVFNLNLTKRQSFTTRRRNEILLTSSVQARQQSRETSPRDPGVVRLNVNVG